MFFFSSLSLALLSFSLSVLSLSWIFYALTEWNFEHVQQCEMGMSTEIVQVGMWDLALRISYLNENNPIIITRVAV